jgi:hypothetical protein
VSFVIRTPDRDAPETPEALFRSLRPRDRNVRDLLLRQGDALRGYAKLQQSETDVAIELPTGGGKTLVGLLVAEWRRRALGHRVAYVCPTVQLARQVASKAYDYGLDVVTLVRRQADWDGNDFLRFQRGQAVAIVGYHQIFNSNPRLDSAQTLILDDAHAAEDAVASNWSIRAKPSNPLYGAVTAILNPYISEGLRRRLAKADGDPRDRGFVALVGPEAMATVADSLEEALNEYATQSDDSNTYVKTVIGTGLASCLAFVSTSEVLVRPLIPPTDTQRSFSSAEQRIYMSATLGVAGELERAFGVPRITRVSAPGTDAQGFGRRLFLMPQASREDGDSVVRQAIAEAGRALILTPSTQQLEESLPKLVPEGVSVVRADEVEESFDAFAQQLAAVLALANRYDGIDLPDESCRLVILSGLPAFAHLQERFIMGTLGARRVLSERVRTRIQQGAGRATRNARDFAAVIVRDHSLIDFLARDEELKAMPEQLQAEIEFGFDNSESANIDFIELLRSFWAQDENWQAAESALRSRSVESVRAVTDVDHALARSAEKEVLCWQAAFKEDLTRAVDLAQEVTDLLSGGSELRPYRALWFYLAASWASILMQDDPRRWRERAETLRREADGCAKTLAWTPIWVKDSDREPERDASDGRGVHAAEVLRRLGIRGARFETHLGQIAGLLAGTAASDFEAGLQLLGEVLGFESVRPNGQADPDSAWRDGEQVWILAEAKTEERPDTPLSAETVRQASTHAAWTENVLGWERPEAAITVIISDKSTIDSAAKPLSGDLRICSCQTVRDLAGRAAGALRRARAGARGLTDKELADSVSREFNRGALDTASLFAELGARRVADG